MALAVMGRAAPAPRDPTGAAGPRGYVFEELFARRYNESLLDATAQGALSRSIPGWARLAAELRRHGDDYDVIVTWSERVTLALMALDRVRGAGKPHVAMLYWFSRPSVRLPMLAFASSLQGIVTWSSAQRRFAIERLGIPAEKLYLVKHYVDELFWHPIEVETDTICAAGAEMRDYPTLLKALRGTGLSCHIASDHVRVDRFGFARRLNVEALSSMAGSAGSQVTLGRKTAPGLRDLYARSRFVVVPLHASDADNGITVILEAMAMGKPVICSRTRGQVDVIRDGVTGIFVPVGDPEALRRAMLALWNDPERAKTMGQAGRAYVEKYHPLATFCSSVKSAIDASLDGRPAAPDGSLP